MKPMPACRTLTEAIHDNLCRLWCDGEVVKPHFVVSLKVVPRLDNDGRWTADVVSAVREAWERPTFEEVTVKKIVEGIEVFGEVVFEEVVKTIMTKPPYQWEFDIDEVVALLPVEPEPEQPPPDEPNQSEPDESEQEPELGSKQSEPDKPRRRSSRAQERREAIRNLADKEWPDGGWERLSTERIKRALRPKLEAMGIDVPKSLDTFNRALGRRD
jgi:hypothetical protein